MLNTKIIDFHKGEFDYMCLEEITVNSRDAIIIMKIIFIQPECWCNKIKSIFKKRTWELIIYSAVFLIFLMELRFPYRYKEKHRSNILSQF